MAASVGLSSAKVPDLQASGVFVNSIKSLEDEGRPPDSAPLGLDVIPAE